MNSYCQMRKIDDESGSFKTFYFSREENHGNSMGKELETFWEHSF